jgi:hypothetical protein
MKVRRGPLVPAWVPLLALVRRAWAWLNAVGPDELRDAHVYGGLAFVVVCIAAAFGGWWALGVMGVGLFFLGVR